MEPTEKVHFECTYCAYDMKITMPDGSVRDVSFTGGVDKGIDGKTNGIFSTTDPELIEAMKANKNYNRSFSILKKRDVKKSPSKPNAEAAKKVESKGVEEAPTYEFVNEEAETIQEAGEFIVDTFEASKNSVSSGAKIKKWLLDNPGKVQFVKIPMLHEN